MVAVCGRRPTPYTLHHFVSRVCVRRGVFQSFFCESSLLRINQRHHSLRTRLWYTPPAAVKKTTEENIFSQTRHTS